MIGKGLPNSPKRWMRWLSGALVVAAGCWAGTARAQTPAGNEAAPAKTADAATPAAKADASPAVLPESVKKDASAKPSEAIKDPNVQQAGCASCGGGVLGGGPAVEALGCCCGDTAGCCVPGRLHCCSPCCGDTVAGRFLCGLYNCICCPDPCYEPHWVATANAAFFVDQVRPITQMDFKFDGMYNVQHPDRAEFLIPRAGGTQNNAIANCLPGGFGKGAHCISNSAEIESLSLYTEGAIDRVGIFTEMPYREYGPRDIIPWANNTQCCNFSGFGDLTIGTKTLLLDCELLQLTFQFKTEIPTGNFLHNLGVGHVSLEPALLFSLKLTPDTYLQGELAYWIPIGGDPLYEGNIFHSHFSLNQVLWRFLPDVQLIGTAELNEYSVLGGNYTAFPLNDTGTNNALPVTAVATMVSIGPGIRLNICDKIDFGVGSAFAITGARWGQEEVRAEFRWRF